MSQWVTTRHGSCKRASSALFPPLTDTASSLPAFSLCRLPLFTSLASGHANMSPYNYRLLREKEGTQEAVPYRLIVPLYVVSLPYRGLPYLRTSPVIHIHGTRGT